ncbi:MAG: 1-phosphofructokinase [Clostridiales bacterium]|nr:1-phosphofructokinase [Clostridiales bacterium]
MIVTVTLNPAIDKTAYVDELNVGKINRIFNIVHDAGGKGINVSKTILALGGNSIATGYIGGYFGMMAERSLVDDGVSVAFVHIDEETRTNTKIISLSGDETEFNEPGPSITEFEKNRLIEKLVGMADKDTIFVLSGSIPQGIEKTIYRDLTFALHEKGAKVFSDIDGEAFKYAMEAVPDLLKPNKHELLKYFDKTEATEAEIVEMGRYFIEKGVETVVISCGSDGAVFLQGDKAYKGPAVKVKAVSTVGAGDAMMAVFAYYSDRGYSFEEAAKMSMAVSAGSVTTEGTKPASMEVVNALLEQVTLEVI